MNARTDIQIINGANGLPAFVVMPYEQFVKEYSRERHLVPNDVVGKIVMDEITPARAWREHLGLTQGEVAERAGMTQAALSQIESGEHKARKATRAKIASALGITVEQMR
jgi:DNA-binding XRE family transcriptional regulator